MSIKNIKLSVKIPLIMIVLAVLNAGVIGSIATYYAAEDAKEGGQQKLESVREDISTKVHNYFEDMKDDLVLNAKSNTTMDALREFQNAWGEFGGLNQTDFLQKSYIDENKYKVGEKHSLDFAQDNASYSIIHASYHPWFREILQAHEYYDLMIINADGDVLYTVEKERDFATNLVTGKWKDSVLGDLFRTIKAKPVKGEVTFTDFKEYAVSGHASAFIGTPIMDPKTNAFNGVFVYQIPLEKLNKLTVLSEKVGKTIEAQFVGEDRLQRNDPHPDDKIDPVLKSKIDSDEVTDGFAGKSGTGYSEDDGVETLSTHAPFDAFGKKWVLVVDIYKSEFMADVYDSAKRIVISALCVLFFVGIISCLYARSITKPIKSLNATMKILADRDYSVEVPYQTRGDEMGDMAKSVNVFKENGIAVQKLESEQESLKLKAEEDKKIAMNKLADDFDMRTSGIIKSLAAAATEMQATAAQMTNASTNTAHASQIVASAATEADSNVQTVASATEELSASSSEIARQISSVAEKSTRASGEAARASEQVKELNSLADSIGEVIGAIKEIAEQTNLLALNATIEAARAGEAGKGFAVVADEVKKLATETASKTVQIDERVGKIQSAIRGTVDAVGRIISDVNDIDHSTSTVASAVEEQNAATSEIGRNIAEASAGTQQVAQNITDVQRSAEETGEAANNLNSAANELAEIAENLQEQVGNFLSEIRSN